MFLGGISNLFWENWIPQVPGFWASKKGLPGLELLRGVFGGP